MASAPTSDRAAFIRRTRCAKGQRMTFDVDRFSTSGRPSSSAVVRRRRLLVLIVALALRARARSARPRRGGRGIRVNTDDEIRGQPWEGFDAIDMMVNINANRNHRQQAPTIVERDNHCPGRQLLSLAINHRRGRQLLSLALSSSGTSTIVEDVSRCRGTSTIVEGRQPSSRTSTMSRTSTVVAKR